MSETCFVFLILAVFLIQYEDKLHHRGVWHNLTEVPGTKTTAHLKLSPYVHYTFRVLALNAVGFSRPSFPSRMIKTEPAGTDSVTSTHWLWISALVLIVKDVMLKKHHCFISEHMNRRLCLNASLRRRSTVLDWKVSLGMMFHFVFISFQLQMRTQQVCGDMEHIIIIL